MAGTHRGAISEAEEPVRSASSLPAATAIPRKSERAMSLARHRPPVRFFEDLVRLPDHNLSSRNYSGPASVARISFTLPFSHVVKASSMPLPSLVADSFGDAGVCSLLLEDFSSVETTIPDSSSEIAGSKTFCIVGIACLLWKARGTADDGYQGFGFRWYRALQKPINALPGNPSSGIPLSTHQFRHSCSR